MADDKAYIKSHYPLPAYNYQVTIMQDGDSTVFSFAEVSGLSVEYEPVTYFHGFSFLMGPKIIPGKRQPISLTMKRGIVKGRDDLQQWIDKTYSDPFYSGAKRDILIDLCDEAGEPVIRWKVQGALPVKMEAPTFDVDSNDVAIESMEFVARGLQVDYEP
jgi:phage tail-like protein